MSRLEAEAEEVKKEESSTGSQFIDEPGMVRLIDTNVNSLEEFKAVVEPLLPKDGEQIRSVEVYLGSITATQLAYIFELISKVPTNTLDNLLFWKVTFLESASSLLDYQAEQAGRSLRSLKTIMIYNCVFSNGPAR